LHLGTHLSRQLHCLGMIIIARPSEAKLRKQVPFPSAWSCPDLVDMMLWEVGEETTDE
jgi:hypothetical protein